MASSPIERISLSEIPVGSRTRETRRPSTTWTPPPSVPTRIRPRESWKTVRTISPTSPSCGWYAAKAPSRNRSSPPRVPAHRFPSLSARSDRT